MVSFAFITSVPAFSPEKHWFYRRSRTSTSRRSCTLASLNGSQKPAFSQEQSPAPQNGAPALLRGPEALVGITAVAFILAVEFIKSVSNRSAEQVNTRARSIARVRKLQEMLNSVVSQREFLASAVDATRATIMHTSDYINAARRRITSAEDELGKYGLNRHAIDELCLNSSDVERKLSLAKLRLVEEERNAESAERLLHHLRAAAHDVKDPIATKIGKVVVDKSNVFSVLEQDMGFLGYLNKTEAPLSKFFEQKKEELELFLSHRSNLNTSQKAFEDKITANRRLVADGGKELGNRKDTVNELVYHDQLKKFREEAAAAENLAQRDSTEEDRARQAIESTRRVRTNLKEQLQGCETSLREQQATFTFEISALEDKKQRISDLRDKLQALAEQKLQNEVSSALAPKSDVSEAELKRVSKDIATDQSVASSLLDSARSKMKNITEGTPTQSLDNSEVNVSSEINKAMKKKRTSKRTKRSIENRVRAAAVADALKSTEPTATAKSVESAESKGLGFSPTVEQTIPQQSPSDMRGESKPEASSKKELSQVSMNCIGSDASLPSSPKRRRGRARKAPASEPAPESSQKQQLEFTLSENTGPSKDEEATAENAAEASGPTSKRRRGRPRKNTGSERQEAP